MRLLPDVRSARRVQPDDDRLARSTAGRVRVRSRELTPVAAGPSTSGESRRKIVLRGTRDVLLAVEVGARRDHASQSTRGRQRGRGLFALLAERRAEISLPMRGPISRRSSRRSQKRRGPGTPVPQPMLATHENLAFSMAHGYAMAYAPGAGGHGACQRRHRERASAAPLTRRARRCRSCSPPAACH